MLRWPRPQVLPAPAAQTMRSHPHVAPQLDDTTLYGSYSIYSPKAVHIPERPPDVGGFFMASIRFGKDKPKDERTRNWTIIVYEDSAPDNWRDIVAGLHVPAFISPYHDKDVRADGSPKKPHWHVVLCFKGKKSVGQIQAISDQLSGVHVDWEHCAVGDLTGMVRYLVHYEDADKYQYEIADIQALSGADVLAHFAEAADVDECVGQMMDWLCEQGITSFAALSRYARAYRKDWFRVLTSKRTVFMAQFCKSLQWEADKGMNPFDGNGGERATEG